MKLNIDGSSLGNPARVRAGGLVRDEFGCWKVGFSAFLGKGFNMFAELQGIRLGLKLA